MILLLYSNFLAAILKMANLTVIGLLFSLETMIFAFYGKFPIRMRMSPFSTNDVRMDFFLGFVSEMESRLITDPLISMTPDEETFHSAFEDRTTFPMDLNLIRYVL